MGIRNYKKDHLKKLAKPLAALPDSALATDPESDDPLRFWTRHPSEPFLVDLHVFQDGEHARLHAGGTWRGTFSGRPRLITQLAPVFREIVEYSSPRTIKQNLFSLRSWWRLFDEVEAEAAEAGASIQRVETVSDITEIHRQRAFDSGMNNAGFTYFTRMINMVRKANKIPLLYWKSPEVKNRRRHLPPQWQVKQVRHALKRGWFDANSRWKMADSLLTDYEPQTEEEARLQRIYQRFQSAVNNVGHPRPGMSELCGDLRYSTFNSLGYSIPDMLRGFYPDANDIRMAFHLCLANTGWNPAVLLSLDANDHFIEPHPKDPTRYLMRGYKARGQSEQITEGLFKSVGSAGVILLTLMKRTEPLRAQLRKDLATSKEEYEALKLQGASSATLDSKRRQIVKLEQGVRSPWLYVTSKTDSITWLDHRTFARGIGRLRGNGISFLDELVARINQKRPPDQQLSRIKASDFRDAFAAYAYQVSGGLVLYVMKVLGHKNPGTTQSYLDNTLLNEESNRLYITFSNSLLHEIKVYGRVDPSIIAKWSRDGNVTDEERARLHDYRSLKRSRIGVGCKDPTHPPKHIAPRFEADGQAMCPVQRCTLCLEHAVIFPDSLPGLCKRLAELRFIQSQISAVAFLESSFGEEIENTELALACFDVQKVQDLMLQWERRIDNGEHRVIDFDGVQKVSL